MLPLQQQQQKVWRLSVCACRAAVCVFAGSSSAPCCAMRCGSWQRLQS